MKEMLEVEGFPTQRWPYEQAFANHIILRFPREGDWVEVEKFWSKEFGYSMPDNKTTYEVKTNSTTFYVTFHDATVHVGMGIRPYAGSAIRSGQTLGQTPSEYAWMLRALP